MRSDVKNWEVTSSNIYSFKFTLNSSITNGHKQGTCKQIYPYFATIAILDKNRKRKKFYNIKYEHTKKVYIQFYTIGG